MLIELPLQIGVVVYHLAKLRMLQFYYDFIDKYINIEDFKLTEMDTDNNFFSFSEDSIDKLIKPHMREEYAVPRPVTCWGYGHVQILQSSTIASRCSASGSTHRYGRSSSLVCTSPPRHIMTGGTLDNLLVT